MTEEPRLPVTPLRELYRALGALKEQEQTAVAEAHAEDPRLLPHRLERSVKAVAGYPPIEQPFYDEPRTAPPVPPTALDAKRFDTLAFASHIANGQVYAVDGCEALSFRYVDRELVPLRVRPGRPFSDGSSANHIRRLDLLLANAHDGTPIVAEVKIRDDKLTHFAFVQALMAAAELLPAHQQRRFATLKNRDRLSSGSERLDVYVMAYQAPSNRKYRDCSYRATEAICKELWQRPDFSRHIRRTAYIEAVAQHGRLAFECRFAFERDVGPLMQPH